MAHAYYHALESVASFGGVADDYMPLHDLLDHTQQHIGNFSYRLFLHNTWGIYFIEKLVGEMFTRPSDQVRIPTRLILEQHVREDTRIIPTLAEWLAGVPSYGIDRQDDVYLHCVHSVSLWGGMWQDYHHIHYELNRVQHVLDDARSQRILHNTWGITLLEYALGETFTRPSDGLRMSTRRVLEEHVLRDMHTIPTLLSCVAGVKLQRWMCLDDLSRKHKERTHHDISIYPTVAIGATHPAFQASSRAR